MRARRLRVLAHRVWRAWYDLRNPGAPWLAPGAIRALEERLRPEMTGLEWGSGRSTAWLGKRLRALTSVEHDPGWHARVQGMLRGGAVSNVDLRLVPVPDDRAERDALYWADTAYVRVADGFADASVDLVLVDGLYRQACVARALRKLRPGGYLVVDDSRAVPRLEDWGVPPDWDLAYHDARRALRDTTIWRKPQAGGEPA